MYCNLCIMMTLSKCQLAMKFANCVKRCFRNIMVVTVAWKDDND